MTDEELLQEIENRVRPTICETFSSRGGVSIEGRITATDFDSLISIIYRLSENVQSSVKLM